jgi:Protein of unknown function (DUF1236)
MAKLLVVLAAVVMVSLAAAVPAQTPPQQEVATTPRVNITLEQRHIIKELIKELKIAPAKTSFQPSVGAAIPQDLTPQSMPSEIGQKVPQIKTHTFVVTEQQIVIVDPKDNRVAELIDLKTD